MRVALVQDSIDTGRGGAETSTREMALSLSELGLAVTIVCRAAAELPTPAATPYATHPLPARGWNKALQARSFLQAAADFCRDQRFDLVHAVTPCPAADLYQPRGGLYPAAIAAGLAVTRSPLARLLKRGVRALHAKQRILIAAERNLLRDNPRVWIAPVSQTAGREVARCYPAFPAARVRTVFNAVRFTPLMGEARLAARRRIREQRGLGDRTALLLFVAHNFALKGLRELIEALATIPPSADWRLLVIGRDDPRPYRQRAATAKLESRIEFTGAAGDLRELYAAADGLVHPTWYDPCSRVVLEALRSGLACLTTRLNGAGEAIRGPGDGLLIDHPRDAAALRQGLLDLLALRESGLATQPPADARPDLDMPRHARELRDLYQTIRDDR